MTEPMDRPLHELTDFPKSFARVVEGFCPICGFGIRLGSPPETMTFSPPIDTNVTGTTPVRYGMCTRCDVGLFATTVVGRAVLWTSRPLTESERAMLLGVER